MTEEDTREIVAGAPSAEAINLRSMASWERKQGRVELADVLASTADTIERLTSQLAEARDADDYVDQLNVLCEDFGCEAGSDRLAWLHDQLSELSRLRARVAELEAGLKPFADKAAVFDQDRLHQGVWAPWSDNEKVSDLDAQFDVGHLRRARALTDKGEA